MTNERRNELKSVRQQLLGMRVMLGRLLREEIAEYKSLTIIGKIGEEGQRMYDVIDMLDDACDELSCLRDTLSECIGKEVTLQ